MFKAFIHEIICIHKMLKAFTREINMIFSKRLKAFSQKIKKISAKMLNAFVHEIDIRNKSKSVMCR